MYTTEILISCAFIILYTVTYMRTKTCRHKGVYGEFRNGRFQAECSRCNTRLILIKGKWCEH